MMTTIQHVETIFTSSDSQYNSCDLILYGKTRGREGNKIIIVFSKLTNQNKIFLNARNN